MKSLRYEKRIKSQIEEVTMESIEYIAKYRNGSLSCPKGVAEKLQLKSDTQVKVIVMRDMDNKRRAREIVATAKLKAIEMAENMTEAEAWDYYTKAVDRLYREYQKMKKGEDAQSEINKVD